jgi:hypothetical protein
VRSSARPALLQSARPVLSSPTLHHAADSHWVDGSLSCTVGDGSHAMRIGSGTNGACVGHRYAAGRVRIIPSWAYDDAVKNTSPTRSVRALNVDVPVRDDLGVNRHRVPGAADLIRKAADLRVSSNGIHGPPRGLLPTLTDPEREVTGLAGHGLSN